MRALTLFWILAVIAALVLACTGGQEQPAAQRGGITKEQVEAVLEKLDRAIENRDVDGVLANFSDNAQIKITIEGTGSTMVFTKSQYASNLKEGWGSVDAYEYSRRNTNIIVSPDGKSATVADDVLESVTISGQVLRTMTSEVATLSLEDGKLVATSMEGIVRMR